MLGYSLELIDAVTEPGTQPNEDLIDSCDFAAWVLDGATPLKTKRYLPGASDAAWFVRATNRALKAQLNTTDEISSVVTTVMEDVRAEIKGCGVSYPPPEGSMPSASFAIVRLKSQTAEFANLGDCKIVHCRKNLSGIRAFGFSKVTEYDAKVTAELVRCRQAGWSRECIESHIGRLEQETRSLMNRTDGYGILDPSGAGIPHLDVLTVQACPGDYLLLMTDGFYRLVDTYAVFNDGALIGAAIQEGLASLLSTIRRIEADDPDTIAYPRLKTRDDATAALLVIRGTD